MWGNRFGGATSDLGARGLVVRESAAIYAHTRKIARSSCSSVSAASRSGRVKCSYQVGLRFSTRSMVRCAEALIYLTCLFVSERPTKP
jgi:hypothetical protein